MTSQQPIIVITGQPAWLPEIEPALRAGANLVRLTERAPGYIARLTDAHTVLILVDGDDPEWRFWTTTPKISPATRRIPLLLISDSPDRRADALLSGADFALSIADLLAGAPTLIQDYAHLRTPEELASLERACGQPLPPMAVQGVEHFNAGEYYRQHDLFEALWMKTDGPVRDLYQGILQVGIAYYQITRGNHRGALKMLLRASQWLNSLPDVCQGVDVRGLREDAARVRAELERTPPEKLATFNRALLKPVRLIKTEN
jgi:hypothetical protein